MRTLRLSLLLLFAACCVCDNGYHSIKRETDADAARYVNARDYVKALVEARRVSQNVAAEYAQIRDEYLVADGGFSLVLGYLRDTGARSANFDALRTRLQRAVNGMVVLADRVRRGAVPVR